MSRAIVLFASFWSQQIDNQSVEAQFGSIRIQVHRYDSFTLKLDSCHIGSPWKVKRMAESTC